MASISINAYGNLPQLYTFEGAACVPTAFTNTLTALSNSYSSLKGLTGTTYAEHESTRNELASNYFYTSRGWTPAGSPASLVVEGIQRFADERNFSENLSVRAIGPGPDDVLAPLANFDVQKDITISTPTPSVVSKTVNTPSFGTLEHQRLYRAGIVKIQDIQLALDSGDGVVLGLMYGGEAEGHAVSAVKLEWTDSNLDELANEAEAARLLVVDPLNPSLSYSPSVGSDTSISQLEWNPLVKATGPARSTEIFLTSKPDGSLEFHYSQESLVVNSSGKLDIDKRDTSNPGHIGSQASGVVVFAGIVSARHTTQADKIVGTNFDDVIALDPGRNRIQGAGGSDLFIVGDSLSLQRGKSDIITDFSPEEGDLIGIRGSNLGMSDIAFARVANRRDLNKAMQSNNNIIYYEGEKRGVIYANLNGAEPGLGESGGELLRLKNTPLLSSSDIELL